MRPLAQRRLPAVAPLAVVIAADKRATLSRVGVETNLRTVDLTGVVNHLTIQQRG